MKLLIPVLLIPLLVFGQAFTRQDPSWFGHISRPASGGGGGTSPGTANLLAWFDYNNNAEDATANNYDCTATGVSYTTGTPNYVTVGSGNRLYNVTTLRNTFDGSAQDWAFVIRWRAETGATSNQKPLAGGRFNVTYNTTLNLATIGSVSRNTGVAGSIGPWYTVVASWNNATTTLSVSCNGETLLTQTGTRENVTATIYIADQLPFSVDFVAFYGKQLTQDNVTWLYNSGGTRSYSDL